MKQARTYRCVNEHAPADENMYLYFKKVGIKKSDGFALIEGREVYVIDGGQSNDEGMLNFLISLREKWLLNRPDSAGLEDEPAKLEIHMIISHSHSDHIGILPAIMSDSRFCVLSIYAPERSYRSKDVADALPSLVAEENKMDILLEHLHTYGHVADEICRLPYGRKHAIFLENSDTVLELYSAPFDWSEDRASELEGFGLISKYTSPTYKDNPERGYTNGILNGNSLWVKITKGKHVVLITGDQRDSDEMLGSMIRYYGEENFCCDILKLPHHGEKNYCPYLLEVSKPKITVFTAADGHQTRETQVLCERLGDVFCLCDGNLLFILNDAGITSEGILPRK